VALEELGEGYGWGWREENGKEYAERKEEKAVFLEMVHARESW
jgi:hypothetical protein